MEEHHYAHPSLEAFRRQQGMLDPSMHDFSVLLMPSPVSAPPAAPPAEPVFCAQKTMETMENVCTYDFATIYLLDDQKRLLSESLNNYTAVVGPLPYLTAVVHPGHRSLISSSNSCKSIADLPDAPSLMGNAFDLDADGKAFDDLLSCPSCHMTFRSTHQLKAHRRVHEGEKPFSCQVCHQCFSTKPALLAHVLTHNTLDKTYPCPVCKEVLHRPGMLRKHIEAHRMAAAAATAAIPLQRQSPHLVPAGSAGSMPADGRSAGFLTNHPAASGLAVAATATTTTTAVAATATAAATAAASAASYYHAPTASAVAVAMAADSPGEVLKGAIDGSDPLLDLHRANVSNGSMDDEEDDSDDIDAINPSLPYTINEDTSRKSLVDYSGNATAKKPFVCKNCGKIFTQSGNLSRHRLVHSQEKPFACPVCQKRFSQKSHLKTHQNVHSGERAFQCQICEKRFSQLGHLKTHINVHRRTADTTPPLASTQTASTQFSGASRLVMRSPGMPSVPVVQLFPPAVHASANHSTPAPAAYSGSATMVSQASTQLLPVPPSSAAGQNSVAALMAAAAHASASTGPAAASSSSSSSVAPLASVQL